MMTTKTTVNNGDVTLPITTTGKGQKLIFFNGVGSTQVIWKRVIGQLKGQYEIITFDFRSHGNASSSTDHSFNAFLSDTERVMDSVGSGKPIVVAWSFGADLALTYAASHPDVLAGLVIIDGAIPISDLLVEDEVKMRRLLNSFSMKFSMLLMQLTTYRYSLSGDAIADITVDLDARRQQLLDVYAKAACPITMILATKTAGENKTEHAKRNNRLWREGSERLATKYPSIPMKWLDVGHRLPLTKPSELAREIDDFAQHIKSV
ncbi:MAG: alpha/beta hydrolase [Peptostreptococcaceae bacterium]|nr:alpha/beta hydrolase [Peptostreptococcaceae bacterium]